MTMETCTQWRRSCLALCQHVRSAVLPGHFEVPPAVLASLLRKSTMLEMSRNPLNHQGSFMEIWDAPPWWATNYLMISFLNQQIVSQLHPQSSTQNLRQRLAEMPQEGGHGWCTWKSAAKWSNAWLATRYTPKTMLVGTTIIDSTCSTQSQAISRSNPRFLQHHADPLSPYHRCLVSTTYFW